MSSKKSVLSNRKSQKNLTKNLKEQNQQQQQQQNDNESNMIKDVKQKIESEFQSFQQILKNVYNPKKEQQESNRLSTPERQYIKQKIRQSSLDLARQIQQNRVSKNQEKNETPFQKLQRNLDNMTIHENYLKETDTQFQQIVQYNQNINNMVEEFGINLLPNLQKKYKIELLKDKQDENQRYIKYNGQKYYQILQNENLQAAYDNNKSQDNLINQMKSFSSLADYIKPNQSLKIKKMNKRYREQSRQSLLNMLKQTKFDSIPKINNKGQQSGSSNNDQDSSLLTSDRQRLQQQPRKKSIFNSRKQSIVNLQKKDTTNPAKGSVTFRENKNNIEKVKIIQPPPPSSSTTSQNKLNVVANQQQQSKSQKSLNSLENDDSNSRNTLKINVNVPMGQSQGLRSDTIFKNKNNQKIPVKARFSSVTPFANMAAFTYQNNNDAMNSSGVTEEVLQESDGENFDIDMKQSKKIVQKNYKVNDNNEDNSSGSNQNIQIRINSKTQAGNNSNNNKENNQMQQSFIKSLQKSLKLEQSKMKEQEKQGQQLDNSKLENLPIDLMLYYYQQDKQLKQLNKMLFKKINKYPEKKKRQLEVQINSNNARVYQELRQSLPDMDKNNHRNFNRGDSGSLSNNNNDSMERNAKNIVYQQSQFNTKSNSRKVVKRQKYYDHIKQQQQGDNSSVNTSLNNHSMLQSQNDSCVNTKRGQKKRKSSLFLPKVNQDDPEIMALQKLKKRIEEGKREGLVEENDQEGEEDNEGQQQYYNQSSSNSGYLNSQKKGKKNKNNNNKTSLVDFRNLHNLTSKNSQMRRKFNYKLKGPIFSYSESAGQLLNNNNFNNNNYNDISQLKSHPYGSSIINESQEQSQMLSFTQIENQLLSNKNTKYNSQHLNQSTVTANSKSSKVLNSSQLLWVKNKHQIQTDKKQKEAMNKLKQKGYTHKQALSIYNQSINNGSLQSSQKELDNPFYFGLDNINSNASTMFSKGQFKASSIGQDLSCLESKY